MWRATAGAAPAAMRKSWRAGLIRSTPSIAHPAVVGAGEREVGSLLPHSSGSIFATLSLDRVRSMSTGGDFEYLRWTIPRLRRLNMCSRTNAVERCSCRRAKWCCNGAGHRSTVVDIAAVGRDTTVATRDAIVATRDTPVAKAGGRARTERDNPLRVPRRDLCECERLRRHAGGLACHSLDVECTRVGRDDSCQCGRKGKDSIVAPRGEARRVMLDIVAANGATVVQWRRLSLRRRRWTPQSARPWHWRREPLKLHDGGHRGGYCGQEGVSEEGEGVACTEY